MLHFIRIDVNLIRLVCLMEAHNILCTFIIRLFAKSACYQEFFNIFSRNNFSNVNYVI